MADQDYVTRMRITSDVSGAVATAKEYDKILAKAKELGKKSLEESKKSKAAFGDLSKAVAGVRRVLTGFGTAALFVGLINSINKIKDSFSAARKQAEAMEKIQRELGESKAIQNLARQYDQLADSAARSAAAQNARLDQIDTDVANRRRLDKANMAAAKQRELEALDPEAADYAEKKAEIEARYAAQGANMEASNAREDIVLKRQRLGVEAKIKDKEAADEDANTKRIKAELDKKRRMKSAAEIGSVDLNEADKGGGFDTVGKTLAQLFTGQWGRLAGATTEAGDNIRQAKAKEAADLELRIATLEDDLRKSEDRAGALRTKARNIRKRADSMGTLLEASDVEMDTARRKGDTEVAAAAAALAKKQEEEAEKIRVQEDAARANQLLEAKKDETERLISEQKRRKAEAKAAVGAANGNVSMYQSAGDSRGATAASAQLVKAQTAAAKIGSQADIMLKALNDNLSKINSLLSEANSVIQKNNSQRLTSQAQQLTSQ